MPTARNPVSQIPAPRTPPPAELLTAVRRGDQGAWDRLVRTYNGLIVARCLRLGLERARCDDVAQTTWMRLFQNLDRLREDAALSGWLITTSTREAYSIMRREGREVPTEDDRLDIPDRLDRESEWEVPGQTAKDRLLRAIDGLPDRDRCLILALLQPTRASYRQISADLGMPVGSIGPIRQRALRKLRTQLSDLAPWAPDPW
jgi:RNA polymerase sigma factor (sigma-70 family)